MQSPEHTSIFKSNLKQISEQSHRRANKTHNLSASLASYRTLLIPATIYNNTMTPTRTATTSDRFRRRVSIASSRITTCVTALLLLASSAVEARDAGLVSELSKHKVTPNIIDASSAELVQVFLHGKSVKAGSPVQARHFKEIELLKTDWYVNNNDAQHTLILLDLDRKLRLNQSQPESMYNLYTSINIPGHDVQRGQAIVSIEPPTVPCTPSQKHRILMLVFHQDQTIDLSDIINIAASPGQSQKRENFNLATFISRHRLHLVAANIFLAVGEQNGVCNGAASLTNSFQSLSSIVIEMVIVGTAIIGLMMQNKNQRQAIIVGGSN